jgi:hypothetical protein
LSDLDIPGPKVGPRLRDIYLKGDTIMRLTPPKVITWWIALILGALGLLGYTDTIAALSPYSFWLVMAGLVLLLIATLVRNL